MNFETAPFKLTTEYLDIMDGYRSDNYEYYKSLIIKGFLETRKHYKELLSIVGLLRDGKK